LDRIAEDSNEEKYPLSLIGFDFRFRWRGALVELAVCEGVGGVPGRVNRGGTTGGEEWIACGGDERGGACTTHAGGFSSMSSCRAGSEAGIVASEDKSTCLEVFAALGCAGGGTAHVVVLEVGG
jgi:hypothetical protein